MTPQESYGERRRREKVDGMLAGNILHARRVREAVTNSDRDASEKASMLRSIDTKIERWGREMS